MHLRRASITVLLLGLAAPACGGGTTTSAPSGAAVSPSAAASPVAPSGAASLIAPSGAPATGPSATGVAASDDPGASLDPTRSDAGIAARVKITNDSRGGRDGTHDIYGVAEDGSECSGAFEAPNYGVVAWYDDAPNGMIHRFSISVGADDIPETDGMASRIEDGRVSFDFVSETGVGTQYTGDATGDDEGSSTVDITRTGSTLTFDFSGVTYDGVSFAGQLICADAGT